MTCDEARKLIALCYYGELDAAESDAMRRHFESCGSGRAEFAAVDKTLRGIAVPDVPEMPEKFWRDNAAQIMKRVASPTAVRPRRIWMRYAAAAAAVVVLCLLGLSILLRTDQERQDDGMLVAPSRNPEWDQVPREEPKQVPDIPLDDPVLADVEENMEMESLEEKLTGFWDEEEEIDDGFSAEFEKTLDSIENSIDELMLELDLT